MLDAVNSFIWNLLSILFFLHSSIHSIDSLIVLVGLIEDPTVALIQMQYN